MMDILRSKSTLVRWALLVVLIAAFLFINWPFLGPLVLAGIFALGLNDFINTISRKTKLSRNSSITLTVLAGFAIFWIPITLAIYRIVVHISQPQGIETDRIVSQIHNLKEFVLEYLKKVSDWTGTDVAGPARGMMENTMQKTGEMIFNYSSQFLGQLPAIFLASFVFTIVLIVLLVKSSDVRELVMKYSPFNSEATDNLVEVFKSSCSVTLFSTLVIGLIQASIIGIGSLIFGEGDFWLVLTVTFFVSFIPVIGAAPVGFLLAVLAFIGGRTGSGVGLTIVAIIAGTIDNILKPFMVGKENKINPVVGFTCVVGAIIMMGLPGLLIGPVIMNLFVGLSPILIKDI
ncbi:AI-2E family transporter [uncultured Bdellovibrio sp.]|uniref:AI-2E family transporter n=1 Tax=Bdellovibrio sp. HCB-162 TaxID=3394234 RepID=UPI0025FFB052|nr:AI-2E family transporter [uncultured Bdellovibrio sp.]